MFDDKAVHISSQCRHYAMCKIDYLGTGLCPGAKDRHYVSFYPQGRMDIYYALSRGKIPLTPRIVDIAESCDMCGICGKQCYFVTGLRPLVVMKALKEYVDKNRQEVVNPGEDEILRHLREITGQEWSSNDPADLAAYAEDPSPITAYTPPQYITLPENVQEVSAILKLCKEHDLPWAVRGNGSSVMGLVMSTGVVIDLHRMDKIEFDMENWSVTAGPGVAAFELQEQAYERGFRVNTAEPSALVCANVICSGIFSLFSTTYGTMADNIINAQFVNDEGDVVFLNDRTSPNLFSFTKDDMPLPGICSGITFRLHPVLNDEEGILVPFETIENGLSFARGLAMRRIGIGIGVLGVEYMSSFMAPTAHIDREIHSLLQDTLGLHCLVLVIGTAHDRDYIRSRAETTINQKQFTALMLGLPRLLEYELQELLTIYQGDKPAFHLLFQDETFQFVEAALNPVPEVHAKPVEQDLRSLYISHYTRPETTDLVWLNSFRILSARLGRKKHVVSYILYVPLDKPDIITSIIDAFGQIAMDHEIDNEFGFITPIDMGKRAVLEYDYFLDHRNNDERERIKAAMSETAVMIEHFSRKVKGVTWIRYIFHQGMARKEPMLYGTGIYDEI